MFKKSLLLMLLLALFMPWAANAQSVQIGDGTGTNNYLPSTSTWNYSVTQQIYTAEEIAASGNITSIAFYNAGTEKARKYNIYMAHTTKSAFESTTDWIALTDADIVYEGKEDVAMIAGDWTTFTLDTPFAYNGTDNLVIGVLDLTGSWSSGLSCRAFTAANQALYKYQDDGAYDINGTYNGTAQTGTIASTKNQIVLGGIQQAHPAPTGLTATPHPTTADLSWTENGTATQWEVAYKTSAEEEFTTVVVNTNPYTLTGLIGETAYNVKVRAYYSAAAQSNWSAVVNFTTQQACPAPTVLASSNLTVSSATLTWTAGYEESDWVLQYGTTSVFTEGTYTEVTVNGTPTYEVTGLSEFTTYYAHVKADCGGDSQSAWSTMLTFTTKESCPDGKICIGDGVATSSYLPANNYYKYSLSQQIYTADEIGEAGAILSIDFFKAATTAMVKDLDIYMVSTTKDEFASATDFVPVTSSDLVFSGTVTFADNAWTTIELDAPFIYDGTSNVAIMVDNNTGGYVSSTPFYVFTSDKNQALYAQSDGTNYDPFAPAFSSRMTQKNRIRLAIGEPPACAKPTGLTVNYTGGTEATISWTSDATAWNMRVNGTPINGTITNPYTLTGLEMATNYTVEVQANCGDATSDWTAPVSFTTDACLPEDQCEITYELSDSYGDGWNSNYINVVDVETQAILATWTISSGSSASGTLAVCDGREIQFQYVIGTGSSNTYPSENSWVIKDVNEEVIWEITSPSASMSVDYTTNCTVTVCRKPTVAVEAAAESATITIIGDAETYNLRYRTPRGFNYGFEQAEAWTITDFDPCTVYDGDQTQCYGFDGQTFTNIPFTGSTIAFQTSGTNLVAHTGNAFGLMISAIPDNYPDGVTHSDDWFILPELTIDKGYIFSFWGREITTQYGDETVQVGIYGSTEGTFETVFETLDINSTTYTKYEFDLSEYEGQTIRLAINYISNDIFGFMFDDIFVGDPEEDTWDVELANITSPYEITGLTESTEYEVQAQANCGENGVSDWGAIVTFMTKPLCEVPTNVAVADITTNSAVVTWESEATSFEIEVNGDVTSNVTSPYTLNDLDPGTAYSVRVRANCGDTGYSAWTTAVSFTTPCLAFDLPYEYGFETADDMSCWSMMAANSANSFGRINVTAQGIENFAAYDGDYAFIFGSYNSADDYTQVLISPELNSGDAEIAFEFYYRAYGSGTEEVYVLYSTATNDLNDFEIAESIEATNTDEWLQYQTTLPAGTKYVALYYYSNYQYYLFVDGFKFEEATSADVTQTITFPNTGTSTSFWFSTYIQMDPVQLLEALEDALGENGNEIKYKSSVTSWDEDEEEWDGGLQSVGITNDKTYMIKTNGEVTVTLEGPASNPEDYVITLNSGWNWIGFPCGEAVDINEALAGFDAIAGDQLKSKGAAVAYDEDEEEWGGSFSQLVPGTGYMFYNADTATRTLTFQKGSSKARQTSTLNVNKNLFKVDRNSSVKNSDSPVKCVKTKDGSIQLNFSVKK